MPLFDGTGVSVVPENRMSTRFGVAGRPERADAFAQHMQGGVLEPVVAPNGQWERRGKYQVNVAHQGSLPRGGR